MVWGEVEKEGVFEWSKAIKDNSFTQKLKDNFKGEFKITKYNYNGKIPESVEVSSKSGENYTFFLNTGISYGELKKFLDEGISLGRLEDMLPSFSNTEFSGSFQQDWFVLIKNDKGNYVPVYLLVFYDLDVRIKIDKKGNNKFLYKKNQRKEVKIKEFYLLQFKDKK